jgi:hypothetical protein
MSKYPLLRFADHDFVAIEKPFALAIRVAVDAYETAIARDAENLDDRPRPAQEPWDRPAALLNVDPIPAVDFALGWLRCYLIHMLPSFIPSKRGHLRCPQQIRFCLQMP